MSVNENLSKWPDVPPSINTGASLFYYLHYGADGDLLHRKINQFLCLSSSVANALSSLTDSESQHIYFISLDGEVVIPSQLHYPSFLSAFPDGYRTSAQIFAKVSLTLAVSLPWTGNGYTDRWMHCKSLHIGFIRTQESTHLRVC